MVPEVNSTNKKFKQTVAERIVEQLINSNSVIFHDQHGETYLAEDGVGSKVLKLSSNAFRSWISYYYWNQEHKVLSKDSFAQIVQTLSGYATFEGPQYDLSVRISRLENELWYDLANDLAVVVSSDGWRITARPPIIFRRVQQVEQTMPVENGDINLLRSYVNVASEDDWLLFVVYLIAAYIPGFPHPLLILHGPQGAGKTTPMRIIKSLVDPSIIQGLPLPDKVSEFVQIADHHAFLFFDNLSKMPTTMSDTLARAATGDSFSKRQLYTDSDDVIYRIQKTIALNGINQVITKPDLLDRSILIKLKRISTENRIPEDEFWQSFNSDKSELLGAIFDVLVKAIGMYPSIELSVTPRMADFAKWGCAIAKSLGYDQQTFLNAYQDNIDRQNEEAIEASPVARAVIDFMSDKEYWQGTAEVLLKTLNHRFSTHIISSSPLWPKAPEWMTRRLNDVETNLNALGIRIDNERTKEGRTIVLSKVLDTNKDNDDSMSVTTENLDV